MNGKNEANLFINRYRQIFEENFSTEFLVADAPIPQTIRVNTLKISHDALLSRLKERLSIKKIPYLRDGYSVSASEKFSISSMPEHLMGYFYIQEAASQLPVQILNPEKYSVVLDMCASPGSKTTQIAQLMQNTGSIIATDVNLKRIKALENNIDRLGVSNVMVYKKDARYIDDLGMTFDYILLDAPCSGNYAIDDNWFEKRDMGGVRANVRRQKELVCAAAKVLAPGGILVYSTCSLEPEENEEIITWALENLDVSLERISIKGLKSMSVTRFEGRFMPEMMSCIRLWPHITNTSGFFIAKLRKK